MVRRSIVALLVLSVVAAAAIVGPPATSGGPLTVEVGPASASAQEAPHTIYCGPWRQAWFVSRSEWWYFWWWRYCYSPWVGGWYHDWAGWRWDGPAPGHAPGFYYNTVANTPATGP